MFSYSIAIINEFPVFFLVFRDHFYQYGEIRSVAVVPKQSCAFVQFTQRDAAERAAKECFNKLVIDGKRLTVKWGKPPSAQAATTGRVGDIVGAYEASYEPVPGLPTSKTTTTSINLYE